MRLYLKDIVTFSLCDSTWYKISVSDVDTCDVTVLFAQPGDR